MKNKTKGGQKIKSIPSGICRSALRSIAPSGSFDLEAVVHLHLAAVYVVKI